MSDGDHPGSVSQPDAADENFQATVAVQNQWPGESESESRVRVGLGVTGNFTSPTLSPSHVP